MNSLPISPNQHRPPLTALKRKPVPDSSRGDYGEIFTTLGSSGAPQFPSSSSKVELQGARRSVSRRRYATWLPEIASFALAILAMAAMITVLATHQNKPLPDWPALISINSLVAIFTAILKATIIFPTAQGISELKWVWFSRARPASDLDRFDAASRGPLGALALILQRPTSLLVMYGAAITILAIAIDPFTQQVLRYYNCLAPNSGLVATIPRTNNYTSAGGHDGAGQNVMDPALSLSIYEGLLNPPANASASVPFHCSSGNCTIPESNGIAYHSLAICFDVEDLTQRIVYQQNSSGIYYNLPSGLQLSEVQYQVLNTGASDETDLDGTAIFSFEMLMLNYFRNESSTDSPEPFAFGARLYPCVHSYSDVNISRNVLHEQISDEIKMVQANSSYDAEYYFSIAGNYPSVPDIDCSPAKQQEGSKTAPALFAPDGRAYFVDRAWQNNSLAEAIWYDPGCTYEFGALTVNSLRVASTTFFGGQNFVTNYDEQYEGPDWLLRLYADSNVTMDSASTYVEGLANAMTAVIRQGLSSIPAEGIVLSGETCISVEWRWLVLPIALIFLAIIFLGATVTQSRRIRKSVGDNGRQPWKSSSLPLLFCSLPDEVREFYGTVDTIDRMTEYAETLDVRLRRMYPLEVRAESTSAERTQQRWILAPDVVQ